MKKILFLFFCLSLGFVSCSSDDDKDNNGNNNKDNYKDAIVGNWIEESPKNPQYYTQYEFTDRIDNYFSYTNALATTPVLYGGSYEITKDSIFLNYISEKMDNKKYAYAIRGEKLYLNGKNYLGVYTKKK